jgi:CHASE2 domain-containing sensor protein
MNPRAKFEKFLDNASRSRLMVYACVLGLIGLALMTWSLFDQGWIPVMAAMSVGQGIGTLSFALFLVIVIIDLRKAEFRPSVLPEPSKPLKSHDD